MTPVEFDLIKLPQDYNPESKTQPMSARVPGDLYNHMKRVNGVLKLGSWSDFFTTFFEAIFKGEFGEIQLGDKPAPVPLFDEVNALKNQVQKQAQEIENLHQQSGVLERQLNEARQEKLFLTQELARQKALHPVTHESVTPRNGPVLHDTQRYTHDTLQNETNSETPPSHVGVTPPVTGVTPIRYSRDNDPAYWKEQTEILEAKITEILEAKYAEEDGQLEVTLHDLEVVKKALDESREKLGISEVRLSQIWQELVNAKEQVKAGEWAVLETFKILIESLREQYAIEYPLHELLRVFHEILIQYPHAVSSGRQS